MTARQPVALALVAGVAVAALAVTTPRAATRQHHADDQMATIPAGDFWMGRTRLWLIDEINWQIRERMDDRPVHRVSLDAFAIDTHEVSNADYAQFVKATGADAPYHWGGSTPPDGKATLPVYNVSWHDAVAYCGWLGKRLPTEAEWEKAARGGLADMDYPWGNAYETESSSPAPPGSGAPAEGASAAAGAQAKPARVKHAHSGGASGPRPVGSFPPNGFGLHDVSGNVWEWVADWYDLYYYGVSPIQNPKGPAEGMYKVIRGGSWADDDPRMGAVYFRNYANPDERTPVIGVRCAK